MPDEFRNLVEGAAQLTTNMINEIETYARDLQRTLEDAVKQHEPGCQKVREGVNP